MPATRARRPASRRRRRRLRGGCSCARPTRGMRSPRGGSRFAPPHWPPGPPCSAGRPSRSRRGLRRNRPGPERSPHPRGRAAGIRVPRRSWTRSHRRPCPRRRRGRSRRGPRRRPIHRRGGHPDPAASPAVRQSQACQRGGRRSTARGRRWRREPRRRPRPEPCRDRVSGRRGKSRSSGGNLLSNCWSRTCRATTAKLQQRWPSHTHYTYTRQMSSLRTGWPTANLFYLWLFVVEGVRGSCGSCASSRRRGEGCGRGGAWWRRRKGCGVRG